MTDQTETVHLIRLDVEYDPTTSQEGIGVRCGGCGWGQFVGPDDETTGLIRAAVDHMDGTLARPPGTYVMVPTEPLAELLAAYTSLTAMLGPDVVPPEADAAFDVLNDALAAVQA